MGQVQQDEQIVCTRASPVLLSVYEMHLLMALTLQMNWHMKFIMACESRKYMTVNDINRNINQPDQAETQFLSEHNSWPNDSWFSTNFKYLFQL